MRPTPSAVCGFRERDAPTALRLAKFLGTSPDGWGPRARSIHIEKAALLDYKHRIRAGFKFYSQDLINNLFMYPYTKIEFVERDLGVSRLTATKYLDALTSAGFVDKVKVGRSNYYINVALNTILTRADPGTLY